MSLIDALLLEGPQPTLTAPYQEVWVAFRADASSGSGTMDDPFNGNTQARFDALMSSFTQDYTTIHLGPGEFLTNGNGGDTPGQGWRMRKGWKILGSGIDVTTLKVVGAAGSNKIYRAIGPEAYDKLTDYAEVSDLTVDCNMAENSNSTVGAVYLSGSHTRLRRVKAIDWGTETGFECFVLAIGGAHPDLTQEIVNPVVEDCICVEPHKHNRIFTTVIHCFAGESASHQMAYNRSPVLRRNFVDCTFADGESSFILTVNTISRVGLTATCETTRPHGRLTNDRVLITNVGAPSRSAHWFGYFTITYVNDYKFNYTLAQAPTEMSITGDVIVGTGFQALSMGSCRGGLVEDNLVLNTWVGGPYHDTFHTRELIVRRNRYRNVGTSYYGYLGGLSAGPLALVSLVHVGSGLIRATTSTPHGFSNNEQIKILLATPTTLNGARPISNVGEKTFDYTVPGYAGGNGSGGIAERDVAGLTSLTHLGAGVGEGTATVGPIAGHRLIAGDRIKVSNATVSLTDFTPRDEFNGFFELTAVSGPPPPDMPDKFKYNTNGVPAGDAFNATFQRFWGVDRLVVEDNVIELWDALGNEWGLPIGIQITDNVPNQGIPTPPPYTHGEVVMRNNVIRLLNGIVDPAFAARAISIAGAKHVIVEDNIVDLAAVNPIQDSRCGDVRYLNNRTSGGALIQGQDAVNVRLRSELEVEIEDVMILS